MSRRWLTLLLLLVTAASTLAQDFRAKMTGRVLDPSGASVASAQVEVRSTATGETVSSATDSQGVYNVLFLRPGDYTLIVTAQGFKKYQKDSISLVAGQSAGLDVTLEVGQVSESVTVTAETALLETQSASRGTTVNTKMVQEIPLVSRNPLMLAWMQPAVTFRGAAIWQQPFANGAIADWSINGGPRSNNEFLLDGAPNNAQAGTNNIAYVPIVDSVQEVSIQTNSYDAAYGKTAGGIVNMVVKSGTANHHATGWGFFKRPVLTANTFQNNAIGAPRPRNDTTQWGLQVDGPVHIPKLMKSGAEKKLFYLFSFEKYKELLPQPLRLSYPEPEMRQGDFSKLVNAAGAPISIFDPATGRDVNGVWTRDAFPGNRIPQGRIHPVSAAVTKYMPPPAAKTAGVAYSQQNLLLPDYTATYDYWNWMVKADANLSSRHRMFWRYGFNRFDEDRSYNAVFTGPGQDGQHPFIRENHAFLVDWVGTLTPTLVVNLRGSAARYVEGGKGSGNEGFDMTSLGLPSSLIGQLPGPIYFGRWEWQNYTALGRYQSLNYTNTYSLAGTLTKIWGTHTIKAGADARRIHYITQNNGNVLRFLSNNDFSRRIWNQGDATSGDGYATFLLGTPTLARSDYPLFPFFRQWYIAPYIQDDWKVTRRLTLNLGLRWDINTAPTEKYNRMTAGFDASAASPVRNLLSADSLALYPNLRNLNGALTFAGVGRPTSTAKTDLSTFQPRIGAAYQIGSRTVLRGGWGLYFLNPNNSWMRPEGFSTFTDGVVSPNEGRSPVAGYLGNPFPTGILTPPGAAPAGLSFVGRGFDWFNQGFILPNTQQFSLGVQYQVNRSSTVEVSYVGSRTRDAQAALGFNLPSSQFRAGCNPLEGGRPSFCDELLPNPFLGIEAFRGSGYFSVARISRYDLNRPHPQFQSDLNQQGVNFNRYWYNSMQTSYNLRFQSGLTMNANYVFSKSTERVGFTDPFNRVGNQGPSQIDRPHSLKFSVVYELPFGKGRAFLANANGFLDRLVNGWQVSTFWTAQSGEPMQMPSNVRMLKDPRLNPDWKAHQVRGFSNCALLMDNNGNIGIVDAARRAACGDNFANYHWLILPRYAPRETPNYLSQIRLRNTITTDFSLNKMTQIAENLKVQFRAEAFNLLNRYNYGYQQFTLNPLDPNFGTVFPAFAGVANTGLPRTIQLGFKVLW